jgi:hypothetical protein
VPHFFNSKEYIIRAQLGPRVRQFLAPGLPYNQALLDVVEIISKPGTIVNSQVPAPIGAAHMDAAMAVYAAVGQCLQLALYASPKAPERDRIVGPHACRLRHGALDLSRLFRPARGLHADGRCLLRQPGRRRS